jgi:hypothetical protein
MDFKNKRRNYNRRERKRDFKESIERKRLLKK